LKTIRKYIARISLFVVIFSISALNTTKSQTYNIQNYTTREGISHNEVRSVARDSSGFLWIATWDGLNRFDGYSFRNYYYNSEDSLSIPYFSIMRIVIDRFNNLWLFSDLRQAALYDRNKDNFSTVDRLFEGLPSTYMNMCSDKSGNLWLIGYGNLYMFNREKGDFDHFRLTGRNGTHDEFIPPGDYYFLSVQQPGKIWLLADNLYEFEKASDNSFQLLNQYSLDKTGSFHNADYNYYTWYRLIINQDGQKWLFTNKGVYLLDETSMIFRRFTGEFPGDKFSGEGYLYWSDPFRGITIHDPKKRRLYKIPHEKCQLVKEMYFDKDNILWFSNISMNGSSLGLNKTIFTNDFFKYYPLFSSETEIPSVYALAKDNSGSIWVGLRGQDPLLKIAPDGKTNTVRIPSSIPVSEAGAIRSLTYDGNGFWIGFYMKLLLYYDIEKQYFTKHDIEAQSLRPFAQTSDGSIIFSAPNNSLAIYDPSAKRIRQKTQYSNATSIYKILVDSNNIIWAGGNFSTLIRYDPASNRTDAFVISGAKFNIEDICFGENGDMWLALLGGGVCRFNPGTGSKTFYTTSSGLANNITYSILRDSSGNYWVSTNTGISRINHSTGIIRSFGSNDGLVINEFNSGASLVDDDGQFYMGGMGGIVSFYPEEINRHEKEGVKQKVFITEINVSGEQVNLNRNVSDNDTLILERGSNNFQVSFSSADFINSNKTIYRYRLSGIEENWIQTDSRHRSINYANLKPGWYRMAVQATDRMGNWSSSKFLDVRVQPYFYQTLAFRIIVPLLLIFFIAGMIWLYIRQIKQKAEQQQDTLRLRSLQGQMNPHFIFNSLNSINYFISKNDALSANRYIADFSKLIRSILYNFSSDYISLNKEIESIEEYLKIEHLRFGDKFNYKVSYDSDILSSGNLQVSPGLVQPFVENAIWHGIRGLTNRKGNVKVIFEVNKDKVICTVEDDGIGRAGTEKVKTPGDKKKSKGISIVSERMRIINNLTKSNHQILINDLCPDKNETGTRVTIDIPVKKN